MRCGAAVHGRGLRARWLGDRGFTIGIDDVTAPEAVAAVKKEISDEKYQAVDDYIKQCPGGRCCNMFPLCSCLW